MNAAPSRPLTRRLVTAIVAGLAVIGGVLAVSATSASWTDSVSAQVSASAGTWQTNPPPGTDTGVLGPLTPGTGTALTGTTWTVPSDPTAVTCFTTTVSTTSGTAQKWSIAADLSQAPYYGATTLYYTGSTQASIAVSGGTATITGVSNGSTWNADWNNALLTSAQRLTVTVCTSNPGTATVAADSAYTVTTAKSGTWTRTQACVVTTITSTRDAATNPFFHGWRTSIDLSAATAALRAAGGTPNYTSWDPSTSQDGYWFSTTPANGTSVATSFDVTSGPRGAVKPGQPVSITTCVRGG